MSILFSATTLEECIKKAANELQVPKEHLKYTILEQKKTFFRKHVKIEVLQYDMVNKESDIIATEKIEQSINDDEKEIIKNKEDKMESGIKVENGNVIVANRESLGNQDVTIEPCDGIILLINGKECTNVMSVGPDDNISIESVKEKSTRKVDISVSEDKMEAYITITYTPEYYSKLIDKPCATNCVLKAKKVKGEYPPKYTSNEIQSLLKDNKIVYGIIKENLEEICKNDLVEHMLIAKGEKVIEDIPDTIEVFFESNAKKVLNDENERIDYRNMYSISNVKIDDLIAEKIDGTDGKDGINIFGKEVKRAHTKRINIKTGEGCIFKDNKIIATIEGRPSCKSGIYSVNKVYTINDVDMKSGNINFIGDVEISGSVKNGTEVKAGNSIIVKGNVEEATISSGGQVTVSANALNSKITAGCKDINKKKHLEILKQYESIIEGLITSVKQMKNKKLLGDNKCDGEIIKLLIENKFKNIPRLSMLIISFELNNETRDNQLLAFIREKIIGLGPIKIKNYLELHELKEMIRSEIEILEEEITIPVDIYVSYSQDSIIEASGNVFVTGKGQYISKITALDKIEFTQSGAVCRGGILCARNEINLKTVGSIAGVVTRIEVSKTGCIIADIAYQNTTFCFGEKQIMLDVASRDVKAYLGKDGMIVLEKFLL